MAGNEVLRVGVGGPVGSGKTALLLALCTRLRERYEIAVVTNDIYTREDAEFLTRSGALPADRIAGVGQSDTEITELTDLTLYVIDVSAGDKIPRKGGPGITRSDLLIINKTDLAPLVGASLEVMARDARRMRGEKPFVFTNLKTGNGLDAVEAFIVRQGMLRAA